jgi:hypothetical protein
MIVSKDLLNKIRKIIENHFNHLTISILGNGVFTAEELAQLATMGIDTSNPNSFLRSVYVHNLINNASIDTMPASLRAMLAQQKSGKLALTGLETMAIDHLNETFKGYLDKLKQEVVTNMSKVILENNMLHKFELIAKPDKTLEEQEEIRDLTMSKIKQELRDATGKSSRNWDRIVSTEMGNAIGMGSADRIAKDNVDKDAEDVYVYRIIKNDAKLCKYCRKFYLDNDGTPKLYRFSELLGNGTNYGKKAVDWLPVLGAVHPYDRCSPALELKPGWKLLPGGKTTFIGLEKWKKYIKGKVK